MLVDKFKIGHDYKVHPSSMKIQILKRDEITNDRHRSIKNQLFLNCFEVVKKLINVNKALKDAQTCTSCTHIQPTHIHTHTH